MSPPNILILLADQERYDVTAPGGPAVRTPNIDRLRREGMAFDRAYTPISICTSARASLLSGLYPHAHGMLNNCHEPDAIRRNFPDDVPTFGERLARSGYRATYTGKWHVGCDQGPRDFGFEVWGEGDTGHSPGFRRHQREHGIDPDGAYRTDEIRAANDVLIAAKTSIPVEATRPYYLAERTIEALEAHAESSEPFCHRLDFVGPHHPYVVPEPYASMYDPAEIDRWENATETDAGKPRVQAAYRSYRGVDELSWDDWSSAIAKYFGFVTLIDEQIGRVLNALDDLPIEDTVTIHTSDHGDFTGSHRQFNKGPMMYEETYHIPLYVRWPAVVGAGATCEEFVRLLDLMPTFLDLAEIPIPEDVQGRSLLPLLRGETPPDWPQTVFAEYHGDEFGLYSQRMVRSKRYKYVYNPPDVDELYDLQTDPAELTNLVDHPDYVGIRDQLRDCLVGWMERTDDPLRQWSRTVLERDKRSAMGPARQPSMTTGHSDGVAPDSPLGENVGPGADRG